MSNLKSRDIHARRMLAHLERVLEDRAESAPEPPFSGIYGTTQMNLLLDVLLTDRWSMALRKIALATTDARPDIQFTADHINRFVGESPINRRTRAAGFARRLLGDEQNLDLSWLMLAACPGQEWTYNGWIDRLTAAVNAMADELTGVEEGLLPDAIQRYERWMSMAGGFPSISDDPFKAVVEREYLRSLAAKKDRDREDRAAAAVAAIAAERSNARPWNAADAPVSIRELATAHEGDVDEQTHDATTGVGVLPAGFRATGIYKPLAEGFTKLTMTPDLAELRKTLRAEYPHAWTAIDLMLGDLRPGEPLSFRPMILVGSPGCGKSRLIRRMGELLNVKVRRYDAAGSSDNAFGGTPKRWTSATPCFPLQSIADTKTANVILMVDEIDKCGQGSAGSLAQALMPFLEHETAAAYPDPCLEVEADLSRVNYALTANDDSRLPSPLRDRIRIIRVPSPGREHIEYLSRSILKDLAAELSVPAAFMQPLAPDELSVVAQAWGDNGSVRKLQKIIRGTVTARDQHAVRH